MPPICFRGACYLEKLDVLRENGLHTVGLRFHIFYEGSYFLDISVTASFTADVRAINMSINKSITFRTRQQ